MKASLICPLISHFFHIEDIRSLYKFQSLEAMLITSHWT